MGYVCSVGTLARMNVQVIFFSSTICEPANSMYNYMKPPHCFIFCSKFPGKDKSFQVQNSKKKLADGTGDKLYDSTYCETHVCGEGQGDCDSNEQCEGDLVCGDWNCHYHDVNLGWETSDEEPRGDCCVPLLTSLKKKKLHLIFFFCS